MNSTPTAVFGAVLGAGLCSWIAWVPEARADRVITADGRVLTPLTAREESDGYRLVFEHGEVVLEDKSLLQAVEIEGDMSEYEPQDDDERDKLAQGFVRFEGRWLSKPAYQAEVARRLEASRKRLDLLRQHAQFRDGWLGETKHFEIKTNTSPELLEYYAELLEEYYSSMDKRIGIRPTPTYRSKKMKVNIYKSRSELHEFSRVLRPGAAGFFDPSDGSLSFYHDYVEPEASEWAALRECTHLLTFLIDQQYVGQLWLDEAVADYFGSSTITRDERGRLRIEPGKLQPDLTLTVQQAIEADKHVRLEDLFFIDRPSFLAYGYAQAWSFVYFLNHYDDGKYSKGFTKFFKDVYTLAKGLDYETVIGRPPSGHGKRVKPEAIRDHLLKCIKVKDLAELEEQWIEFMQAIRIDAPEALLKRGIRAARGWNFVAAIKDLDTAIESGSNDPRAFAYRGMARWLHGQTDEALTDLARAIEVDPLNAQYRYNLSQMLTGRLDLGLGALKIAVTRDLDDLDAEEEAAAAAAAGLAMDLAPENDRYREWYYDLAQ